MAAPPPDLGRFGYVSIANLPNRANRNSIRVPARATLGRLDQAYRLSSRVPAPATLAALQRRASSVDQLAWCFELPRASQQRRGHALQRRASSIDQLARRFELPRASMQRRANAFQRKRSAASGQLDRFSQSGIRCATDLRSSIVPSQPASTSDQPND